MTVLWLLIFQMLWPLATINCGGQRPQIDSFWPQNCFSLWPQRIVAAEATNVHLETLGNMIWYELTPYGDPGKFGGKMVTCSCRCDQHITLAYALLLTNSFINTADRLAAPAQEALWTYVPLLRHWRIFLFYTYNYYKYDYNDYYYYYSNTTTTTGQAAGWYISTLYTNLRPKDAAASNPLIGYQLESPNLSNLNSH